MKSPLRRLGLVCSAATVALVVATVPSGAAPAVQTTTDPAKAAAGWLAQQFVNATHKPSPSGDHFEFHFGGQFSFDGGTTADAIFGLAAAKAGKAKIDTAMAYLAKHVDEYTSIHDTTGKPGPFDGSVAKVALAAMVTGADPNRFGGFDLLQALKDDECTAVSIQTTDFTVPNCPAVGAGRNIFSSVAESFVILAESRAGGAFGPSPAAIAYFLSLQCPDGGFDSDISTAGCTSGLDETSYAVPALSAMGGHGGELTKALTWLRSKRNANGSWTAQGGQNTDSTGLAASALGNNGTDVTTSRAWLASQQVTTGVTIGATASRGALKFQGRFDPSASVKATADGLLGLARGASLATLTDTGASTDAPVLAPTAKSGHLSVGRGTVQTAIGIGFSVGESVRASVHSSSPVAVGTVKAATDGTAKVTFTVPSSLALGRHTVELTGLTSGLTASTVFSVTPAPAASPPSTAGTAGSAGSAGVHGMSELPATGTDRHQLIMLAVAGTLAIVVGTIAVVAGRRRRT